MSPDVLLWLERVYNLNHTIYGGKKEESMQALIDIAEVMVPVKFFVRYQSQNQNLDTALADFLSSELGKKSHQVQWTLLSLMMQKA